jgi:ribosomal protein S26
LVTFCVETAFYNRVLKERKRRDRSDRKNEEEDVGSYWMTLSKEEDTLILRTKL